MKRIYKIMRDKKAFWAGHCTPTAPVAESCNAEQEN